ncbi:DUF1223 domain-containing protein [Donghicola mangrovi]|uniref:DUF1223 domain-containing protein n=1 Tax=Donghicola mangrovi TaxID=2729614 RepID=A0A850PZS5_9RHOB|nr:DUF1223 domain-containing protein [Donghicola mangrovi]NVO22787.1 DUF1223 domain-containing protein [Donghicola mangrovi]
MGRIWATLACMGLGTMAMAQSAPQPVVIELYTSQGCSSCPSADKLLEKLAGREDVLPLSLHVDYWDYIGWVDTFAHPAFTERQKIYARNIGERMIYTPQMIVNGTTHVVGNRPMDVADALNTAQDSAGPGRIDATLVGAALSLKGQQIDPAAGPYIVQFITYVPQQTVQIMRGENAGKEVTYVNVVSGWNHLGEWDGQGVFSAVVTPTAPEDEHAVIVQQENQGAVVAAARLR